jgi:hypothetical protein
MIPLSEIVVWEPESVPPVSVDPVRLTGKDVPVKNGLFVAETAEMG